MKLLLTLIFFSLFSLPSLAEISSIEDPIPNHDSLKIFSEHLKEERIINIWLPPNYHESSETYPVIYMPDGGIEEDFPHIANTLAKLIKNKEIPPCLLVGIENTERGRDLSGESLVKRHKKYNIPMTDGAKDFRSFIADELIPKITALYRVNAKKGIIGESLAGLFVMETLFLKPEMFDFYMAMDPSLWWNKNHLVKNSASYLKALPNKGIKLWFAGSSVGDISKYTNQLAAILAKQNPNELTWRYSDEPNEKHSTIFRATKEKALIWTLNEGR